MGNPKTIRRAGSDRRIVFGLRSEEHTSELQSQSNLVCRLLLEKKKQHHTLSHPKEASANHVLAALAESPAHIANIAGAQLDMSIPAYLPTRGSHALSYTLRHTH